MLGVPPEVDPKRRPKNPAGDGPATFWNMIVPVLILIVLVVFVSKSMTSDSESGSAPAKATSDKPPDPRKPATIMDDDVSVLVVYPSVSWERADVLIREMAFAKSEWQKKNPQKHIVASDHLGDNPDGYGYCWVLHYEKR